MEFTLIVTYKTTKNFACIIMVQLNMYCFYPGEQNTYEEWHGGEEKVSFSDEK